MSGARSNLKFQSGNTYSAFHLQTGGNGKVRVRSRFLNHPGICAGYRLYTKEGSIAFLPDNEPFEPLKLKLAERDGVGVTG